MDLHDIRATLQAPSDFQPRVFDIAEIMASGARIRRRRRAMLTAGATALVLAASLGATSIAGSDHQHRRRAPVVAASRPATGSPEPSRVPRLTTYNDVKGPLGDVIDTGLTHQPDQARWVIFAVTGGVVSDTSAFGFAIGTRDVNGDLTEVLTISEDTGPASAAGFHPMQRPMSLDDGTKQPMFGYYVGRPARISVTVNGRPIDAQLAPWSHEPDVTVFWFSPADVAPEDDISDSAAYDAAGHTMVQGHVRLLGS